MVWVSKEPLLTLLDTRVQCRVSNFVMHLKGYVMKFEGCDDLTVKDLKGKGYLKVVIYENDASFL